MATALAGQKVRVGVHWNGSSDGLPSFTWGLRLDPRAELVAICDTVPELLEKRRAEWQIDYATTDPLALCASDAVDAVVIATPNDTHRPIALAARPGRQARHVREAPRPERGRSPRDVRGGAHRGRRSHDGFQPTVSRRPCVTCGIWSRREPWEPPRHFRSQRFLDWPETSWGWRQYSARAGAGDLFDMTIHRIDFAHRSSWPDFAGLRGRRAIRATRCDCRRPAVPPIECRRLVKPDWRVRQRRDGRLGRDDARQGLSPRRLRT